MNYLNPIEKVLGELKTTPSGLTEAEAQARLRQYGKNVIVSEEHFKLLKQFLAQFRDILAIILMVAGILSIFFGETRDALIIFGIVLLNAAIGFFQEYKAEKAIQALKKIVPQKAVVSRNGEEQEIGSWKLVPGDVVVLDEGDNVPADIRLLESNDFFTNDAVLTGEGEPQQKEANIALKPNLALTNINNMVFLGTSVVRGNAKGVVVSTGMATQFGKIAHLTQAIKQNQTPLQREVGQMAKTIAKITLAVVFVMFGISWALYNNLFESFGFALGIAAATVPEGLAATISVALAVGVSKMAKQKAIIKRLNAVETLGATTVIVTDKTGTLTKNEMTVKEIWVQGKNIHVEGVGMAPEGQFISEGHIFEKEKLKLAAEIAVLCNEAELEKDQNGKVEIIGDQTEGALLVMAQKAGINVKKLRRESKVVFQIPFTSERKKMSVVAEISGETFVFSKGAPLELLGNCSHVLIDGKIRKITKSDITKIKNQNDAYAKEVLRVLGFAYKEIKKKNKYNEAEVESNLIFVGLVGIIDPPKSDVKEAIELSRKAGIKTIMVTGDYELTALAIGKRIGLFGKEEPVMINGTRLNHIRDDKLKSLLRTKDVIFARVDPNHKFRIVSLLQELGEVVAVTGDGVNDAPALKKADVGVAMGITGTDVSKEASEMIITNDNFSSIVKAVREGRIVYDNLKKFIRYILSSNATEFFTVITGFLFGVSPILAVQILFIDLGTDVLPSMALAVDNSQEGIMERPPRDRKAKILSREMLAFLLQMGIFVALLAAAVFLTIMITEKSGISSESQAYARATTAVYAVLVLCQAVNSFFCRGRQGSFREVIFENKKLLGAAAFSFVLLLNVIYNPLFWGIFKTAPLYFKDWILAFFAAVLFYFFLVLRRNFYNLSVEKPIL